MNDMQDKWTRAMHDSARLTEALIFSYSLHTPDIRRRQFDAAMRAYEATIVSVDELRKALREEADKEEENAETIRPNPTSAD